VRRQHVAIKMTKRNAKKVLAGIEEFILKPSNPEDSKHMLEAMNRMLDDLLTEDFFGTEGQLDPRGDQRD
jgi:hypothetical protein